MQQNIDSEDYMFVHIWPVEGEDQPACVGAGFGMTVFNSYVEWVAHMELDPLSIPKDPEDLVGNEYRMIKYINFAHNIED